MSVRLLVFGVFEIDAPNPISSLDQVFREVMADKAPCACNEYFFWSVHNEKERAKVWLVFQVLWRRHECPRHNFTSRTEPNLSHDRGQEA